jgi:hypothetical protein
LAQPPKRNQSYAGSVLDQFISSNRLLSLYDRNRLKTAIAKNQPKVIRSILAPIRIWLWPAAIEEVIAHNVAAENEIEAVLRTRGLITQSFSSNQERRKVILKKLKGLAHEPTELESIIQNLWTTGLLNSSNAKSAVKSFTE